jgi:hypothetical protein
MAWSEQEIDDVLDSTVRSLRGTGETDGGVHLPSPGRT